MADIIVRVVFNGSTYDLDVDNNVPVRLDVSAVENQRIGNFFGVGSQKFSLPGTKKNNRFFKHAYEVGVEDIPSFYLTIPGYLIYNGETLLKGQFQLLEAITDQTGYVTYEAQITDEVVQFKDALANQLISQGDWSAYNHTLTSGSIVASWSDNLLSGSVFYPLCDLGSDNPDDWPNIPRVALGSTLGYINNASSPMSAKQFLPAIKVKDTLDVIFDQVNYRYTGSFTETQEFNSLYILPKSTEGLGIGDAINNGLQANSTSVQSTMTSGTDYTLNFTTANDPGNNFNFTTNTYTAPATGKYTMGASLTYITNPVDAGNTPVQFQLQFFKNGVAMGVYDVEQINYGDAPGLLQTLPSQTYNLTAGDLITLKLTAYFSGTNVGAFPYIVSWNLPNASAPTTYEGVSVNMATQWDGQTKSLDILKGLIEQFNLVLTPDFFQPNTIQIETFDTWIRQGRQLDWTEKFNTATRVSIKHTVNEQQREIKLSGVDDADRFSKVALEDTPNYQYGTLRLLSENNISQGERKIGTLFAPVILGSQILSGSIDASGNPTFNLDNASNFVFPHLYKFENREQKSFKFKPRLGYKVTNALPSNIYVGLGGNALEVSQSYATISNLSALPAVTGSTLDLHYNNTYSPFIPGTLDPNDGKSAYEVYWKTYLDSLYWDESRKVVLDIQFNKEEYKSLRLNDIVFIKDQRYRINSIKGFNVSENDIATVELIRLYPQYFEGVEPPALNIYDWALIVTSSLAFTDAYLMAVDYGVGGGLPLYTTVKNTGALSPGNYVFTGSYISPSADEDIDWQTGLDVTGSNVVFNLTGSIFYSGSLVARGYNSGSDLLSDPDHYFSIPSIFTWDKYVQQWHIPGPATYEINYLLSGSSSPGTYSSYFLVDNNPYISSPFAIYTNQETGSAGYSYTKTGNIDISTADGNSFYFMRAFGREDAYLTGSLYSSGSLWLNGTLIGTRNGTQYPSLPTSQDIATFFNVSPAVYEFFDGDHLEINWVDWFVEAGIPTPTPTPTPTFGPTPTPTPTPTLGYYAWYITQGESEGDTSAAIACSVLAVAGPVYTSVATLSNGVTIYTDTGLTLAFNGNPDPGFGNWFGFNAVNGNYPSVVFEVNTSGVLSNQTGCGTPTPTPTPTTGPTDCYTYSVQNNSLVDNLVIRYYDCDCSTLIQDLVVLPDSSTPDFCACSGSVERQSGTFSWVLTEEATSCTVVTPTPTATPSPTPTPNYQSHIAERFDGAAYDYVAITAGYGINDVVLINDGSGQCWTLGAETITAPTYTIISMCTTPTPTPSPTPTNVPCTAIGLEGPNATESFSCTGGPTYYMDSSDFCSATVLYRQSDCTRLALAGYYFDQINQKHRYWNGTSFTTSCTITSCP